MMMFIIGGSSVQPAPILEVTLHAEAEEHLSRAMKCDEELAPSLEIGPRQQDKVISSQPFTATMSIIKRALYVRSSILKMESVYSVRL